ncbi:non-specific lipid-transfer protein 1-like isoform X1 [Canna indica]|uniref:Non-specific lipid-transfer protein n=1 Tax=Canna indica TaxID=4628 RepID=A0AAQ3L1M6_9LILI|nr:non-specific lipid-transfer protein 1-like isoform X1 [Canna indica]
MARTLAMMTMILILTAAATRGSKAITCSQVYGALLPCVGYLQGEALDQQCCSGMESLLAAARSTKDRRATCSCIETAAAATSGVDYGRASELPGKCGVSIPFKISPNTDCSKYVRSSTYCCY